MAIIGKILKSGKKAATKSSVAKPAKKAAPVKKSSAKPGAKKAAPIKKVAAKKVAAKKAAPAKKAASAKKAVPAKKVVTKKAAPAKKAAPTRSPNIVKPTLAKSAKKAPGKPFPAKLQSTTTGDSTTSFLKAPWPEVRSRKQMRRRSIGMW